MAHKTEIDAAGPECACMCHRGADIRHFIPCCGTNSPAAKIKTYPRMTYAASHKYTCNLCDPQKNSDEGCNCGASLIDLIRSEMMSDEYPISDWEFQFAEKIRALPMFAAPDLAAEVIRLRGENAKLEAMIRHESALTNERDTWLAEAHAELAVRKGNQP